jgi:hypothetical protein
MILIPVESAGWRAGGIPATVGLCVRPTLDLRQAASFRSIPKKVYQGTKPMAFAANVGFNPGAALAAAPA